MSRDLIERSVLDIMSRLRRDGFKAYLVGGCVRDLLLGKKPKDFDVVTDARPRQIKRLYRRCFLIGRRFRLAHVYISHDRFVEVATFRALVDPEKAPEEGSFAENNMFGTIDEDAQRRDFTVNGLYYDSADGSILDYGGGLEDLKKKIIRSIGDPLVRFKEDPVRIVRAARFCAQLGFRPSKPDLKAAIACAPLITQANAHRMLEELFKILRCGAAAGTVENLKEFGILEHWLPDIDPEKHPGLLPLLAAADRRRARGIDVPVAVLLSALLYGLFGETLGERRGFQNDFTALHQQFPDLPARMRFPRKEWDSICNIVARVSSFTRIPDPKKGKGFEKRFVRNAHFPNALMFFEMVSEAEGKYGEEVAYWKERATAQPQPAVHHQHPDRSRPHNRNRRPRHRSGNPAAKQNPGPAHEEQ